VFWAVAKQNLAVEQQIQAQNDGVSSHNTLSEAAEPTHVLHMDPMTMSDVSMCDQLLWWTICDTQCHVLGCD
jgi:hypothetical protein